MRVCLFEDRGAANLEPLSLTRPVFDLLCGLDSLAAKQCRHFAPCQVGVLVRPWLADVYRLEHPQTAVNDTAWLRAEPTILVNGRWLPPSAVVPDLSGPSVFLAGDEVAYAVIGTDRLGYCSPHTIDDCLAIWKNTLPNRQVGGRMMSYPWELVQQNGEQIGRDFAEQSVGRPLTVADLAVVGPPEQLLIDPTARIDPLVAADTTNGPVVIEPGAVVTAFTRLEGPCCVGPYTHILGAKIRGGTTVGPHCRIGGEVEASIVQGYTNKYHDGFLGHSYLGAWVNLGAGTHNSDLRNDYGEVSVVLDGRPVETGLTKVGCFMGDHTKTGLAALLNTGTHIGAFCSVLPSGGYAPKYVPSFASWWKGQLVDRADLDRLTATADQVMRRRGLAFTPVHAALARHLFEETATARRRATREPEVRHMRRSA